MTYDLLCVGAGLTSATICAELRERGLSLDILVVDVRHYIGGNCADFPLRDTFIHRHGPHNFHSPDPSITKFLGRYTHWRPFQYTVTAEVERGEKLVRVPFPYSEETERILGVLSDAEIVDLFFRGYSEKMWGAPFDELPIEIAGRVPRRQPFSCYFPGHYQATPSDGYTEMITQMFGNVDFQLGVSPDAWKSIPAKAIVYCGRADLILPDSKRLPYRHLNIEFFDKKWDADTVSVNYCHSRVPFTRRTNYTRYGRGLEMSRRESRETPCEAAADETVPHYIVPTNDNRRQWQQIAYEVAVALPKIRLAGRCGTYQYLDMWQAVSLGRKAAWEVELMLGGR